MERGCWISAQCHSVSAWCADAGGAQPLPYRQIADLLRGAIGTGQLPAGERLPSEAALIDHFGVARMTVRQAVQQLRSEGLVVSEHGRGVFVRSTPPIRRLASDRFARRHRASGKAAFTVEAVTASQTIAAAAAELLAVRVQATGAKASNAASSCQESDEQSAQRLAALAPASAVV